MLIRESRVFFDGSSRTLLAALLKETSMSGRQLSTFLCKIGQGRQNILCESACFCSSDDPQMLDQLIQQLLLQRQQTVLSIPFRSDACKRVFALL